MTRIVAPLILVALLVAACGSASDGEAVATDDPAATVSEVAAATAVPDETDDEATSDDSGSTEEAQDEEATETADDTQSDEVEAEAATASTFVVEVWVDNWMAVYVDGVLIGEDSVSITTERSFNAETFTFDATYPFILAIEAKDFKETDSGIEYIGQNNQQMGDGGLIAQVTDTATGDVVSVSGSDWAALVVHRAPLNTECEKDADPDATCEFEITETPAEWASSSYDDSAWVAATEWSAGDVGPKDGYDEITWDSAAQLVWGTDLEVDNTILFRTTIAS